MPASRSLDDEGSRNSRLSFICAVQLPRKITLHQPPVFTHSPILHAHLSTDDPVLNQHNSPFSITSHNSKLKMVSRVLGMGLRAFQVCDPRTIEMDLANGLSSSVLLSSQQWLATTLRAPPTEHTLSSTTHFSLVSGGCSLCCTSSPQHSSTSSPFPLLIWSWMV
jgi:hypothetical protein